MIITYETKCCALCHLSVTWNTTREELQEYIDKLKETSYKRNWLQAGIYGGPRSAFVMTKPEEKALEIELQAVGFTHVNTIPRRTGYEGDLKMWMLSW